MKEKIPTALLLLIIFIFANIASVSIPVSATSVDRLSICNIEGHAGDVIDIPITLKSTSDSQRLGQWSTFYKKVEGKGEGERESDDEKMDITSWIMITPANYTLKPGEAKIFTVRISIPRNAKQGLYGATSENADMEGHSGERRTYILFEDADASAAGAGGGSAVQSGMLIPVSVKVLAEPNPLIPIIQGIEENIISIVLVAVIIVLLVVLLRRKFQILIKKKMQMM